VRHDKNGTQIDDMIYHYAKSNLGPGNTRLYKNRLYQVDDAISGAVGVDDYLYNAAGTANFVPGQQINVNNQFSYDANGNLVKDKQAQIEKITWTNSGKIKAITFDASAINKHNLVFDYDAMGNRVSKKEYDLNGAFLSATFYVRDAQGNTLAVYDYEETSPGSGQMHFKCSELNMYGSSRLGVFKSNMALSNSIPNWLGAAALFNPPAMGQQRKTGHKQFELSNHLGNVLAVVSDYKQPIIDPQGYAGYYQAVVLSTQDYYPFGSPMPNRNFSSSEYRFGFNGKENDNEVKGTGNSLDFGARIYDSRLGRWMSCDPLANKYPGHSPFHFGYNNPISFIDPDGKENIAVVGAQHDNSRGNKLMFANEALRSMRNWSKNMPEETRTLVIFTEGYTPKQLAKIERSVKNFGGTMVQINSSKELVNYVNSKTTENHKLSQQRTEDKVTNMDIYSHGVAGAIEFGHDMGGYANQARFDANEASQLNSGAFKGLNSCISSFACRTGSGNPDIYLMKLPFENDDIGNSLAQKISNSSGSIVKAFLQRTSYGGALGAPQDRSILGSAPLPANEIVDGAAFTPNGSIRPVSSGGSPIGVEPNQHTFTPKN
jgi:RHS repeat-associated protein